MALAPSVVQQRLEGVLEQYHAIEDLPQQLEQLQAQAVRSDLDWKQDLGLEKLRTPREGWLAWRQHAASSTVAPCTSTRTCGTSSGMRRR